MLQLKAVILALGLSFCLLNVNANADMLWGVGQFSSSQTSVLFRIENYDSSPVMVEIGDTGLELYDIAYHKQTDTLFALGDRDLFILDPNTGEATEVSSTNRFNSFDIRDDGVGFVAAAQQDGLGLFATMDLNGAGNTNIGDIGFNTAGDIMFDLNGDLYALTESEQLATIDPTTGVGTLIGPTNIGSFSFGGDIDSNGILFASGFPDPTIGSSGDYRLYTLDKTTGDSTLVGEIAGSRFVGINGLTFATEPIPEPSSLLLLLFLLPLFAIFRCRYKSPVEQMHP